ncbi:MAG TPA: M23 family metallopeptidase [Beijerinckiaceae bacterium]|jgi:murein DD-endopeptidase MepM/ murein hydrolase activator NlpD
MRIGGVDRLRALSRFALLGVVGGLAGACSETARFSGNPFSNPFGSSARVGEPAMTGSTSPSASVETQPLAPPAASAPVYNRPSAPAPVAAAPRAPAPTQVTSGPAGWTAKGGTSVTVRPGDSLAAIATRYGVPPQAILSANGLKTAAQVAPGRAIVIPVYNAAGAAQPAPAKPAPVAQTRQPEPKLRFVQGPKGEAKPSTATDRVRHAGVKAPEPQKPIAAKPEPQKPVKEKVAAPQAPKAAPAAPKAAEAPKPLQSEPTKSAQTDLPKTTGSLAAPEVQAPRDQGLGYRWPAKGRVIAGFGGANGNEGINIAVPEGTPVKAAEDGTVAYAGSDVKGYGKLVLIRHDNNYVSAYAHNGEITVKPGEKVKRGQPIAKSGQSGNVTSPQLHFEIRKGPQPIDPMPHLQGG